MNFVVLPDRDLPITLWERLTLAPGMPRWDHDSGRPWVIGDHHAKSVVSIDSGPNRLLIVGNSRVAKQEILPLLSRVKNVRELDSLFERIPGCTHLIASIGGRIRAQGSLSTSRQLFRMRIDGVHIAASSQATLCALAKPELDLAVLAAHLLVPGAPWPLATRTLWSGIKPLDAGHWLDMDRDGSIAERRWWSPPTTTVSFQAAAEQMRAALRTSIGARTYAASVVTADLSGGLDSTSICYLAAATGSNLMTYHIRPLDPHNDDTAWARKAAADMAGVHHVLPPRPERSFFNIEHGTDPVLEAEGPFLWSSGRAHLADLSERIRQQESSVHLLGLGGDELFGAMPAHLWSMWNEHRLTALPDIRRTCLLNRYKLSHALREVTSRRTFAAELATIGRRLSTSSPKTLAQQESGLDLSWSPAPGVPSWMTSDALEAVRSLLMDEAEAEPDPLHPDRSRHQVLESLVFEGTMVRQLNQLYGGRDLTWEAPFLDRAAINASLAAPVSSRKSRTLAKPLLARAMNGIMPEEFFRRNGKGEYSSEMYAEIHRRRPALFDYFDHSVLADLGLIDLEKLRSKLGSPAAFVSQLDPLEITLSHERWLRAISTKSPTLQSTGAFR